MLPLRDDIPSRRYPVPVQFALKGLVQAALCPK